MLLYDVKGDHFIMLIKKIRKKKSMHIIILYEGAFLCMEHLRYIIP